MIDFHTHILPRMDDGSRNIVETRKMLKMEFDQGVRHVVSTSHFYAQREFPEEFLERRQRRISRVREMLQEEEWGSQMKLYAGAEVLYFTGMAESPALSDLCIEKTDTLLLELPFFQWDKEIYLEVKKIIEVRRKKVILAHVERYFQYQKDTDIWDQMLELPVYIQLNTGNIGAWGKKGICRKLLKSELPILLGSDCHSIRKRPPDIRKGRKQVEKTAGTAMLEQIDRLGKQVLKI